MTEKLLVRGEYGALGRGFTKLPWHLIMDRKHNPPVPMERAEELTVIRMAQGGVRTAMARLVRRHLGMVLSVAVQHGNARDYTEDLVSEGMIGLMVAVEWFDPDRGVKFITYATEVVRNYVRRARWQLLGGERVNKEVYHAVQEIAKADRDMQTEMGRAPFAEEISERTGIGMDELWVLKGTDYAHRQDRTTLADASASFDDYIERVRTSEASTRPVEDTLPYLRTLVPRDLEVITMHFGLPPHLVHSDLEIGERLGISKSRAKQVRWSAVERMQSLARSTGRPLARTPWGDSLRAFAASKQRPIPHAELAKKFRWLSPIHECLDNAVARGDVTREGVGRYAVYGPPVP
jgi:RNA polymerase sigma factor (sigma-70 family)